MHSTGGRFSFVIPAKAGIHFGDIVKLIENWETVSAKAA